MVLRTIFLSVVFLEVFGQAFAADETPPPKLGEITLVRAGNGDGTGPEDELYLRGNGIALYKGIRNVERIGLYSGDLPRNGFERPLPLLEKMYESLRGRPHSTGKPTQGVTAVHWKVLWDGRNETIDDLCPGMDEQLWAFEMAARGVAADVAWKAVDPVKAWPEAAGTPGKPGMAGPGAAAATTHPGAAELKLVPANDAAAESVLDALAGNKWVAAGAVNILGEGVVRTLRFTRVAGGRLNSEDVFRHTKDFGRREVADADVKGPMGKQDCEVRGPVLWIGRLPQSFTVVSGRLLALNALVPVGGTKRWYYAAGERDKDGNVLRVEEYLFDFVDDPMTHETGTGAMRCRIGDFPPKADDMQFKVTKIEGRMRYVQIDVDGPNGVAHRARLALTADGDYGLMLDNPNLETRLYTAAR